VNEFEIGEIVYFVWTDNPKHKNFIGRECKILAETEESVQAYRVYKIDLDEDFYASAKCLRKKKPPEKLGLWEKIQEKIGWNPTKQKATRPAEHTEK